MKRRVESHQYLGYISENGRNHKEISERGKQAEEFLKSV